MSKMGRPQVYTSEEARKIAKIAGIETTDVIMDEIQKIAAIFGVDLIREIKIHQNGRYQNERASI